MRLAAGQLTARWRGSTRFQDAVTAAGTFVIGVFLNLIGLTGVTGSLRVLAEDPPWWSYTACLAVGCLAMLIKRRHIVAALLVGVPAVVADLLLGGSVGMVLVLFDLLFSAGLFGSPRVRTTVMTAVVVVIGTGSIVAGLALGELRVTVFLALQLSGLMVVPLWWAANLRQQRELGELTAERVRHDTVHAERSAMARELHDVIASHLSTTAIHSGAALALPPDTERDRAALQAVRTSSLAALEEMRTMIMLLRADAGDPGRETVVPAKLDQLPSLADAARAAGLDVAVQADLPPGIPALVSHAGYRMVHEALTNAAKHAPGSRVRIVVATADDSLEISVTNTLTQTVHLGHSALSAGTGLEGMHERAALLGGSVTAGRDGALWRVQAALPLRMMEGSSA